MSGEEVFSIITSELVHIFLFLYNIAAVICYDFICFPASATHCTRCSMI